MTPSPLTSATTTTTQVTKTANAIQGQKISHQELASNPIQRNEQSDSFATIQNFGERGFGKNVLFGGSQLNGDGLALQSHVPNYENNFFLNALPLAFSKDKNNILDYLQKAEEQCS